MEVEKENLSLPCSVSWKREDKNEKRGVLSLIDLEPWAPL